MGDAHADKHVGRFGRWADSYDRSPLQRILFSPMQEFVLGRIDTAPDEPISVLDVGCGTGQLLRRISGRFPEATLVGVDASAEMIRVATEALPPEAPVRFVKAFAEDLPFEDGTFDLAITTMSFHHWADQPVALREVQRVLKPGGTFLLCDALPIGWLRWLFTRNGHGSFNPPAVLSEMLRAAGLEPEKFEPVPRLGGTIQVIRCRATGPVPLESGVG